MADMEISTKYKTAVIGTKLELNNRGEIVKRTPCARETGTTVKLAKLFATIPVRRHEFQRKIGTEFQKMCHILQGYGLIAHGTRIIVTNQPSKGVKTIVMSTKGSNSMLDNIVAIFGSKQKNDLLEIRQPVEPNEVLTQDVIKSLDTSINVSDVDISSLGLDRYKFDGYISSCNHGSGRSAKDRQYFFINGRPCDLQSIIKVANDAYHRYNSSQNPFIVLNINVKRSDVDVNLTPDKRQVLVHNETILRLALKKSLLDTFGQIPNTYKLQNTTLPQCFGNSFIKNEEKSSNEQSQDDLSDVSSVDDDFEKRVCTQKSDPNKFANGLLQWKRTGSTEGSEQIPAKRKPPPINEILARNSNMKKIHEYLSQEVKPEQKTESYSYESEPDSDDHDGGQKLNSFHRNDEIVDEPMESDSMQSNGNSPISNKALNEDYQIDCKVKAICTPNRTLRIETFSPTPVKTITQPVQMKLEGNSLSKNTPPAENFDEDYEAPEIRTDEAVSSTQLTQTQKIVTITTSIADIIKQIERESKCEQQNKHKTQVNRLKFKAKIDPSINKAAEQELRTEISKSDFVRMDLIGQFNLGFIIVRLDGDLFIVDQHATDEKYNFETLQKITRIQHQPLVVPQPLELTAVNEMILHDNLEMFEMNGFRFEIDMEQPATKRIKLIAKPFSKNWEFGKEEIDELLFMLQEGSGDVKSIDMLRPSRVRAMFASRACRSSVMIGDSLSKSDMRRLVDQMGTIEQPWVNIFEQN